MFNMPKADVYAGLAMQGMLSAFKHWPRTEELARVAELSVQAAGFLIMEMDKQREKAKNE